MWDWKDIVPLIQYLTPNGLLGMLSSGSYYQPKLEEVKSIYMPTRMPGFYSTEIEYVMLLAQQKFLPIYLQRLLGKKSGESLILLRNHLFFQFALSNGADLIGLMSILLCFHIHIKHLLVQLVFSLVLQ